MTISYSSLIAVGEDIDTPVSISVQLNIVHSSAEQNVKCIEAKGGEFRSNAYMLCSMILVKELFVKFTRYLLSWNLVLSNSYPTYLLTLSNLAPTLPFYLT